MGEGWGGLQGVWGKDGEVADSTYCIVVGRERFGGSLYGKYVRIGGRGKRMLQCNGRYAHFAYKHHL
jgi:hypothetical protein